MKPIRFTNTAPGCPSHKQSVRLDALAAAFQPAPVTPGKKRFSWRMANRKRWRSCSKNWMRAACSGFSTPNPARCWSYESGNSIYQDKTLTQLAQIADKIVCGGWGSNPADKFVIIL